MGGLPMKQDWSVLIIYGRWMMGNRIRFSLIVYSLKFSLKELKGESLVVLLKLQSPRFHAQITWVRALTVRHGSGILCSPPVLTEVSGLRVKGYLVYPIQCAHAVHACMHSMFCAHQPISIHRMQQQINTATLDHLNFKIYFHRIHKVKQNEAKNTRASNWNIWAIFSLLSLSAENGLFLWMP